MCLHIIVMSMSCYMVAGHPTCGNNLNPLRRGLTRYIKEPVGSIVIMVEELGFWQAITVLGVSGSVRVVTLRP